MRSPLNESHGSALFMRGPASRLVQEALARAPKYTYIGLIRKDKACRPPFWHGVIGSSEVRSPYNNPEAVKESRQRISLVRPSFVDCHESAEHPPFTASCLISSLKSNRLGSAMINQEPPQDVLRLLRPYIEVTTAHVASPISR